MEDNILTSAAVLLIYENGEYLIIPKISGLDYHINYINYEIESNNNLRISEILKDFDIESVTNDPANSLILFNEITKKGNIVLINVACNYIGNTNYFSAYLPETINDSQKEILKELNAYIKELEFMVIGQYNTEYNRIKSIDAENLDYLMKNKIKDRL